LPLILHRESRYCKKVKTEILSFLRACSIGATSFGHRPSCLAASSANS